MIHIRTLSPGAQSALDVAREAAAFLGAAERSLDLALYDVRLPGEPGDLVAGALRGFCGSFNLSRSGEQNAEDVLELHDAALDERMAAFVDEVRSRYPPMPAPRPEPREPAPG